MRAGGINNEQLAVFVLVGSGLFPQVANQTSFIGLKVFRLAVDDIYLTSDKLLGNIRVLHNKILDAWISLES
ncbi:hypothetical protein D3C72_2123080 [compost metagenome]